MRPTFLGFETARSALNLNQKQLDIVGQNLANINTAGYTRQRVNSAAVAPSTYSTRVASATTDLAGQGVEMTGVSQTRDAFLDKRFRDEYADSSYYIQTSSMLSDIQSALGDASDITEGGNVIASAIQQMYTALNNYADQPTSTPIANLVLSSFTNMTQVLQKVNSDLDNVANQQSYDLQVSVDKVNTTLQKIAQLNEQISGDAATALHTSGSSNDQPNELLDQRNLLLDDLASYGNISVTTESDGAITVEMGGHPVVSGTDYDKVQMNTDSQSGAVTLSWRSSGDLTQFSSGALKAYTDVLNGRGANVQNPGETSVQGILYYKDRLNTMAQTFANVVNNIVPEMEGTSGQMTQKIDANGNKVYKTLIAAKQADGTTDANSIITAANISVSDEWTSGEADYLFSDPGSLNNASYAEQLSTALTGSDTTFNSYGETFNGTFEEYLIDYTGKVGTDTSYYNNLQTVSSSVSNELLDRRDSVSAVQMDEETTNMMTYQKSYNAAARLMTVLDDMLDKLINGTGEVGR
ncbi:MULTISPECIES: flagellar hook-associated protein FlgK [Caproicibacterium]|uniref:Flagellar hook-associated protein 1 n=1 Tax=Caproicibacterium argilliputei TaxID=3030016 RepID=A0AA97D6K6_9FIRM|nr:flagellar hook-associated protein FlgK [Caproicibacterium argilliputei]WOC31279.1 flagellar hook-associated protein FlgK [Caproicibacterium argilliputei]